MVEPLPGDPPGLAAAGTPELLAALVEHAARCAR